jgi:hypothetical protein
MTATMCDHIGSPHGVPRAGDPQRADAAAGPNIASQAATYYHEFRHAEHRGVEDFGYRCVVFGNDGFGDPPAQEEIRLVREAVAGMGLDEEAFGTDPSGYSWALVVRGRRQNASAVALHAALERAAKAAWGTLTGFSCSSNDHTSGW